jgi:hypothetical protein
MKPDANDVFGIVGLGLFAAGVWWIYEPAALIALGLVFVGLHLRGAGIRRGR